MAVIGFLADVKFQVDESVVETIQNFQWSTEANWATHLRQGGNALTEYTGRGVEKTSFDVQLVREMGVDPMAEIAKFFGYCRNGTTLPLTIGTHAYGRYRWTIKDVSIKGKRFDAAGELDSATVTLNLQEYLKQ